MNAALITEEGVPAITYYTISDWEDFSVLIPE